MDDPIICGHDRFAKARAHVVGFAIFLALVSLVFLRPLLDLVQYAAHSELHSYILLVPFVSAYLLYIRRDQLPACQQWSLGWALPFLLAGTAALGWAWINSQGMTRGDYLTLTTFSLVSFLAAGGFVLLGKDWMRAATFPVFFLILVIPMPSAMSDALETVSKLGSAEMASLFFSASGTPVLRDGNVFQLPGIAIQVAQECSGIRSSWVLLITSLLTANLFLKSTWRRALLVGFVIPLGLIRNGFRVFVIGTLCTHYGPQMIHSIVHRRGGPLFFLLSLAPLFLLLFLLRRAESSALTDRGTAMTNLGEQKLETGFTMSHRGK